MTLLHPETIKALESAEVRKRFADLGAEVMPTTPRQFDTFIKDELATNTALVKTAGLKAD